ncbi:MAG TPA: hypothetical protein DEB25_05550 [Desulfobulbaceae bacterium]|nr:hypothetical protein [Desulfobulbaceae bacterium]
MEQQTSVAGKVKKQLLIVSLLCAGLILTGTAQAMAYPGNPPPRFGKPGPPPVVYHQPRLHVVKAPPHHYRPVPPPRYSNFRPHHPPPPRRPWFFWPWR